MSSLDVETLRRTAIYIVAIGFLLSGLLRSVPAEAGVTAEALRAAYLLQVDRHLEVPEDEAQRYGRLALTMLADANVSLAEPQYVALVDRNPYVQAIFVYFISHDQTYMLIGASPVSTGRVGQFDHFETPTGVFEHTPANPDFRAEGTKNKLGIRGYGVLGMRVFDFGWQQARRGWGQGGMGIMRLQMHATDPDILEPRLGRVQSKGCIRISAALNRLLDRYGVLDAAYEAMQSTGSVMWILPSNRNPVNDAGRYLIVVDTLRIQRPLWATYASQP
ncbi:murein L,D-transpeptidase [Herminiimonas aquatilis]|uniref:Murein L,D-transpeptidase n=1 Tax=Herminiimonas aquatilis TaxID=345342 RepID=A0ABW2J721_9BURK